jgi:hypothetical protein
MLSVCTQVPLWELVVRRAALKTVVQKRKASPTVTTDVREPMQ